MSAWHDDSAHQRSWALSPELSAGSSEKSGARRRRFGRGAAPDDRREPGNGRSVSKVAQRYGVNANLLFTWRRQQPAGILLMQSQVVLESDALEPGGKHVRSCLTQRNIVGPLAADSPVADGPDAFLGSVENSEDAAVVMPNLKAVKRLPAL